jgi:hypothetical protein
MASTDDPFAEKREMLLESVEKSEEELREAVSELTSAAQSQLDFGGKLAERPWLWLGGCFAIGLWLGSRSR